FDVQRLAPRTFEHRSEDHGRWLRLDFCPRCVARRSPGLSKPARSISLAIARLPLFAECGHTLGEMGARPHAIPELLLQVLTARGVIGNTCADLSLHRLNGGRAGR